MPLRLPMNSKRYLFPLIILLYIVTIFTLLIWMEHLKPSKPSKVSHIALNNTNNLLSIEGENLAQNLSAVLTPNMQREQDTVSSRFTWGRAFNIAGNKRHLWVANRPNEILSYDISNPKVPSLSGTFSFENDFKAWSITLNDDKALIAGGYCGITYLDISNPSAPKKLFNFYQQETILDSIIKDGTAFVVAPQKGLFILDIEDSTAPKEIGRLKLSGVLKKIYAYEDKAYIIGVNGRKGILHIVDIKQPQQLKIIASIDLPHPAYACQKIDNLFFISMGHHGLYISDIEDLPLPSNHYAIKEIPAFGLCSSEADIFISNGSHHIYHYQVAHGDISHIKTFATDGRCFSIDYINNHIVASLGENGFALFNPSKENTTSPATITFNRTYGDRPNIMQENGLIAIHSHQSLDLFREGKQGVISQYDSINFSSPIITITRDHNRAYVALKNKEIHIIKLQPSLTQRTERIIQFNTSIRNLVVDRSHLYIGNHKDGIFVLDLAPSDDAYTVKEFIPAEHTRYTIEGDYLYLTTSPSGLQIYQLQKKLKPVLLSTLKYPTNIAENSITKDIVVKGDYAFITNGRSGLLSINISDPTQPKIGDALGLSGYCNRLVIKGGYAYVTNNRKKVTVVDIKDPLKMKVICDLSSIKAVTFSNDMLYQLNDIGLYITPLPQPLTVANQSTTIMDFNLPAVTAEGYYDLQLATTQQITKHSDLLHYSQQQGWTMTRNIDLPEQAHH